MLSYTTPFSMKKIAHISLCQARDRDNTALSNLSRHCDSLHSISAERLVHYQNMCLGMRMLGKRWLRAMTICYKTHIRYNITCPKNVIECLYNLCCLCAFGLFRVSLKVIYETKSTTAVLESLLAMKNVWLKLSINLIVNTVYYVPLVFIG